MSDAESPIDAVDDIGDDLFGDDDAGDLQSELENGLSDRDLASDKEDEDSGRRATRAETEEEPEFREKLVSEVPLYRHRIPRSHDGTLHSLRVPDFIKLNPVEYKPDTWEPTKWDLDNAKRDNPVPVILSRRDPKTGQLQSNANIYKWSDGSVTLAIGGEHYEIQTKPLAPPRDKPYQEVQDNHYYAAAAHLTTNSLLIVGHFTEQYTVRPNKEVQDFALERLKATLAQSKNQKTDMVILTTEDPELQKKQAEKAEKELAKLQRRRDNAAARAEGTGRYKGGALSIGDLEGRRAGAAGRKRGLAGGPKAKRRRPEYDSDDDLPSGARRPDNYDMDDGFLVDSDDESEVVDDDDEEEILDDEDEDEAPRTKRRKAADEEEDAEADLDDDAPAHGESSRRRRRIVDDDEEE